MSDGEVSWIDWLVFPIGVFQIALVILAMFAVCIGVNVGGSQYSCADCNCSQGLVIDVEEAQ